MLLSTAYFPPAAWLALAARDMTLSPDRVLPSRIFLEACVNYQKQSYRNRCCILAADGMQMLQVPVVHRADMSIRSVLVDYSTPWVIRTLRALDAAYQTSAWYDYYRDEVSALLQARPETLWELNLSTIRWCLKRLGIACEISPTSGFSLPGTVADDYREAVHPKRPCTVLEALGLEKPYYQVFRDRMGGFTPGMSCLDLLFNEGPDSILWLKKI